MWLVGRILIAELIANGLRNGRRQSVRLWVFRRAGYGRSEASARGIRCTPPWLGWRNNAPWARGYA